MKGVASAATAAVVALTLSLVPLVADWCAATCEAAHQLSVPSCHHTTSTATRIGEMPAPCGHDHQPMVVDAATATRTTSRAVTMPLVAIDFAVSAMPAPRPPYALATIPGDRSSPRLPLALATNLRL